MTTKSNIYQGSIDVVKTRIIQTAENIIISNSCIEDIELKENVKISFRVISPRNFGNLVDIIVKLIEENIRLRKSQHND